MKSESGLSLAIASQPFRLFLWLVSIVIGIAVLRTFVAIWTMYRFMYSVWKVFKEFFPKEKFFTAFPFFTVLAEGQTTCSWLSTTTLNAHPIKTELILLDYYAVTNWKLWSSNNTEFLSWWKQKILTFPLQISVTNFSFLVYDKTDEA